VPSSTRRCSWRGLDRPGQRARWLGQYVRLYLQQRCRFRRHHALCLVLAVAVLSVQAASLSPHGDRRSASAIASSTHVGTPASGGGALVNARRVICHYTYLRRRHTDPPCQHTDLLHNRAQPGVRCLRHASTKKKRRTMRRDFSAGFGACCFIHYLGVADRLRGRGRGGCGFGGG